MAIDNIIDDVIIQKLLNALIESNMALYRQRQRCKCRAKMTGSCMNCSRILVTETQNSNLIEAVRGNKND